MIRAFRSTNSDIEGDFRPYSHFGTAEAAEDRAEALRSFSVDVVGRDPGAFRTIPVLLDIQNPLRMPDLADVDSDTGLSMSEAWERFFNRNDLDQETWDELSDDEREEFIDSAPRPRGWEGDESVGTSLLDMGVIDMDEFEEKGRRNEGAFELLAEKGYDGIVYENVVEAPGSESWINFRGDQVRSAIRRKNPRKKREKVYPGESLSDDDRQRLATLSKSKKRMLGPLESEDCGHGEKRIYRWSWDVDSSPEDSEPDVVESPDCKVCCPDEDFLDNPKRLNSDSRLRELERRWRATRDDADLGRWVAEWRRIIGQDPWDVGLSREHNRPRAARGELWETSIRADEQPVRTVFFGYDGGRMAFTAQLEALASPASYSHALEVLKGLSPNVEFAFVAHPEISPPSFRLILPSGRLAKAVLRPTETTEDARAAGIAERDRSMEFFGMTPDRTSDDWWRPWNPANYPSMESVASEISSRVARSNPAKGAIKYSCDYCGQKKRTCPRCPACGHHVCSACMTPSCHFCDSIRRSVKRQSNPRLKTYVAEPGSLLHVRIVGPGRRPRATLVVEPMIPERPLGSEDVSTPRVCLAPHLGGCLGAIEAWSRIGPPSVDGYDRVVVYENAEPVDVMVPSRRLVGDAPETGEVWALKPVRLRRIEVADQAGMQQEISDVLDGIGRLDRDPDIAHSLKAAMVDEMLGIEQDYLGR